jgi:hypothetical protein
VYNSRDTSGRNLIGEEDVCETNFRDSMPKHVSISDFAVKSGLQLEIKCGFLLLLVRSTHTRIF